MNLIEVISIPVSDQQRSKEFYQSIGFHLMIEAPMGDGNTWVQLGFAGTATSLTLVTWFAKMTPGGMDGLVLKTDDIEKEVAGLQAKGIEMGKIDNTPWGKFASFNDPDGNGLILRQV